MIIIEFYCSNLRCSSWRDLKTELEEIFGDEVRFFQGPALEEILPKTDDFRGGLISAEVPIVRIFGYLEGCSLERVCKLIEKDVDLGIDREDPSISPIFQLVHSQY